jgi:SAM-dependent methyltransferase
MQALKNLLSHVQAYVALQKVVGADRLRYRCIETARLKPGETVLDVGCGPAYYFEKLPQPINYHGFDTEPRYVEWANKKWGGRGATIHLGIFDAQQAARLPRVDAVLLLGLLHHLSDDESLQLLELAGQVLAPGGRVVSVDTCFEPTQGRISRWMSQNDRGEYVREPKEFEDLARSAFGSVEGYVERKATRIPASYWMMTSMEPLAKP